MTVFSRIKTALQKTSEKISITINGRKIDDELITEIEEALILADVGIKTTTELCSKLASRKFLKDVTDADIKKYLAEEIEQMLLPFQVDFFGKKFQQLPCVILVVGVNGNGKTTTVAKVANIFKQNEYSPLVVAADTFRAAAVEQLKYWAEKINVDIYAGKTMSDPAGLTYAAIEHAQKNNNEIVLIDTAGRMQNRSDLMDELEKIKKAIKKIDNTAPHYTILVIDGLTGQAVHNQVDIFLHKIGIDGVIITKLDGSAKGGAIIPLTQEFKTKIFAVGIGEAIDDLKPFNAFEYANALMNVN